MSGCNDRSIECEFDHLFQVMPHLDQAIRACQSSLRQSALCSWASAKSKVGARARKKVDPTYFRLLPNSRSVECSITPSASFVLNIES
jgi:hypothetical protein